MRGLWCQHLTAVLRYQHHILNIKSVDSPNITGHLHGQDHARLQKPVCGGVDIWFLCRGRPQADAVAAVAPSVARKQDGWYNRICPACSSPPWRP